MQYGLFTIPNTLYIFPLTFVITLQDQYQHHFVRDNKNRKWSWERWNDWPKAAQQDAEPGLNPRATRLQICLTASSSIWIYFPLWMAFKVIPLFLTILSVPVLKSQLCQEDLYLHPLILTCSRSVGVCLIAGIQPCAGFNLAQAVTPSKAPRGQARSVKEWAMPAFRALPHCSWHVGSPWAGFYLHIWGVFFTFILLFVLIFNWIYWDYIGSKNHIDFKCTTQ